MKTKICTKCDIEKELSDFSKHPTAKLGVRPECKLCRNKDSKSFYLDNKEKINIRCRNHYQENKIEYSKRHIKYNSKRYKEDIIFKITLNFRRRLLRALNGELKSTTSLKLLGCTPEDLKIHLESQFKQGMSWNNYGLHGWHIDHRISCAKFDLSKEEEQLKCFHYTNLQPLWAKENWSKGSK